MSETPTAGKIADAIDQSGKPVVIGVALTGGFKHCLAIVPTPASKVDLHVKTLGGTRKDFAYTIADGIICNTFGAAPMGKDGIERYLKWFSASG